MIRKDDRTAEQRETHRILIVGTDKCMSGWGEATGGKSYAAWACATADDAAKVESWVAGRSDMSRIRVTFDTRHSPYRPGPACAHLHIYVVDAGHPALS